ncbi:MAG: hypothetical protein ABI743_10405 [bacterium]
MQTLRVAILTIGTALLFAGCTTVAGHVEGTGNGTKEIRTGKAGDYIFSFTAADTTAKFDITDGKGHSVSYTGTGKTAAQFGMNTCTLTVSGATGDWSVDWKLN